MVDAEPVAEERQGSMLRELKVGSGNGAIRPDRGKITYRLLVLWVPPQRRHACCRPELLPGEQRVVEECEWPPLCRSL